MKQNNKRNAGLNFKRLARHAAMFGMVLALGSVAYHQGNELYRINVASAATQREELLDTRPTKTAPKIAFLRVNGQSGGVVSVPRDTEFNLSWLVTGSPLTTLEVNPFIGAIDLTSGVGAIYTRRVKGIATRGQHTFTLFVANPFGFTSKSVVVDVQ